MSVDVTPYPPSWGVGASDGPGLFADLAAKLDLHIGSVSKMTKAITAGQRRPPAQPVFGRTVASGLAPATGPLILRFPLAGPDQGHFWYVRNLVIGGLTEATVAAGTAGIYVSASSLTSQPSLAAIGLADLRDRASSFPAVAFYGRGELPLRLNEELFIIVSGGTSGQQYVAGLQFEDFEEAATHLAWDL